MPTATQRLPTHAPQTAPTDSTHQTKELTSWWRQFTKSNKRAKEENQPAAAIPTTGIFGVPLDISIKYAHVAISSVDDNGQSNLYGYVPIIVAKCGVYLKEKALDVEGIFRLAGAERRIKELMGVFNAPERYGRGLDWTGYTVHDAANLLRRYLNQLPEPIIPLAMYPRFREPLRHHQAQAVGPMDQQLETQGDFDPTATIIIFQQLITELPSLNRQLLLYILDLLAVFSSHSNANRMTAPNLSAIFQPGILRHPDHDMVPSEYRLSQDVVIFLIEHQDHFVIGLPGTEIDQKTQQEVETAPQVPTAPSTPRSRAQQLLGRSTSSASAGSERRFNDVRRHASTNSRGSRQSQHTSSPATPPSGSSFVPGSKSSGVHRSNTVPSKHSPSPALSASERFQRFQPNDRSIPSNAVTPTTPSPIVATRERISPGSEALPVVPGPAPLSTKPTSSPQRSPLLKPFATYARSPSQDRMLAATDALTPEGGSASGRASPLGTPSRERGISSLFKQSPSSDVEGRDGRRPNKLQKKRPPGEINAQASQHSLGNRSHSPSPAIASTSNVDQPVSTGDGLMADLPSRPGFSTANSFQTAREQVSSPPQAETPPPIERDTSAATLRPEEAALKVLPQGHSGTTVRAKGHSPSGSVTSHSTGAEASSQSAGEDVEGGDYGSGEKKKHKRWRFSSSAKKSEDQNHSESNASNTALGSSAIAERSTSSVASNRNPRKSFTDESHQSASARALSGSEAEDRATSPRRGLAGWFKGKLQERQERKEEKERAKSPPARGSASDQSASSRSLSAIATSEAPGSSHQQPQLPAVLSPTPEIQEPVERDVARDEATTPVAPVAPTQISTQGLSSLPVADTSDAVTPKARQQPTSTELVSEPAAPLASETGQEIREVVRSS